MRLPFAVPLLLLLLAVRGGAESLLSDVTTDRSSYPPRTLVTISVRLAYPPGHPHTSGTVRLLCEHLAAPLPGPAPQPFHLAPHATATLLFRWLPPARDFQGYHIEVQARDSSGRLLGSQDTAVDVSSTWTRFPRCGFLSTFPAQSRRVSRNEIQQLRAFHINALQFYDWQYKHQQPLAGTVAHPAASWNDIAGRPTSRRTVLDLIDTAHACGMTAMNYNLLYGAWSGYGDEGIDYRWGLWKNKDGTHQDAFSLPGGWATPTVYLFNPANNGWRNYLLSREENVFAAYPFDGWQVDQLGDRGTEYDFSGHPITLWQTFRPFLNAAKARLHKTIVFNNVGGYGLYDTIAHSKEDAAYVECWEWAGQKTYQDLKTLIDQCSSWSGGKGVILAAYMDRAYANGFPANHPGRFNLPGILLTDAAIFAAGGDHIELGDGAQMLDNEYFPNRSLVSSDDLRRALGHYYDFLVAYENLLRGGLNDTKPRISLSVPSSSDATPDTVWAFAKTVGSSRVIHLINLTGEKTNNWRDDRGSIPAPSPQTNIAVTVYLDKRRVRQVSWASPDTFDGRPHPLAFTTGTDRRGPYVRFTVPRLAYWDMVYY